MFYNCCNNNGHAKGKRTQRSPAVQNNKVLRLKITQFPLPEKANLIFRSCLLCENFAKRWGNNNCNIECGGNVLQHFGWGVVAALWSSGLHSIDCASLKAVVPSFFLPRHFAFFGHQTVLESALEARKINNNNRKNNWVFVFTRELQSLVGSSEYERWTPTFFG